jgi:hypothetical protein
VSEVDLFRRRDTVVRAPQRPSNTEPPEVRAPYDTATVDYPTQPEPPAVYGHVPSAPDPVPVYLTEAPPARRNLITWVPGNADLSSGQKIQVSGVDKGRTRLFLKSLSTSAVEVYVLPQSETLNIGGYLLKPGDSVEFFHTGEVWVKSGAGAASVTWNIEREYN